MDQNSKSNHTVNWGSTHGAALTNLCTFPKLANTSATTSAFQNGYIIVRQLIKLECDLKMWVSVLFSLFLSVSTFCCQLLDAHQLTPTCRNTRSKHFVKALTSKVDAAWGQIGKQMERLSYRGGRGREWGAAVLPAMTWNEILIVEQQGRRVTCFDYHSDRRPTVSPHNKSGGSHV